MPYVPQMLACTVPNSATPVAAAAIAAAQANAAAQDAQVNQALSDWMALIDRSPADFTALNMPPAEFVQPQSAAQLLNLPGANSATPGGPGDPRATAASIAAFRASKFCRVNPAAAPTISPIMGGFVTPPVMVPLTTPPLGPPPSPPAPVLAPSAPRPTQAQCRTGNICADLQSGCVLASQVDPQQVMLCALRGWSGNRNLYPWIASTPGLPYLGMVDPNPPYVGGGGPPAGMSGLRRGLGCSDCGGACGKPKGVGDVAAPDIANLVVGGLAVFAVTYFTLRQFESGGKRRRK